MIAVFRHELRLYFHSLATYVFGAFLLLFIGIGAMIYNIRATVSNFEYVLTFAQIIFGVIVPILTMRILAEERKQRTDQLLYTLPITSTQIIIGKYLAVLVTYTIPMVIVCFYPLIFAQFGDVYLKTAYCAMIAFYLLGASLLALGIFISSLTDNQGFAAGIGIAVIMLNYYSVNLSDYISTTAVGSLIVVYVVCLLLGLLIHVLTKSDNLAYGITTVLVAAATLMFFLKRTLFEGMIPLVMTQLSLFSRFSLFTNGIFDMTALTYYLSFAVFFLFLSVQSLEKRRYN